MRRRLGVAVGADALRAVLVKGDRVLWSKEAPLQGVPLAEAMSELLREAPLPRWPRARATVAIGPSRAQVKRLTRLPPVDDPEVLAAIVREGAGRFFLRNGAPLVTTGIQPLGEGEAWAAALDHPAVDGVRDGCRRAGVRPWAILPTVLAVTGGLENERIRWMDGGLCAEVVRREGQVRSVRRYPVGRACAEGADDAQPPGARPKPDAGWVGDEPPEVVTPLAALGENGWRFADAYGAATLERRGPLALGGDSPGRFGNSRAGPRIQMAAGLWILAGTAGLLSPLASEVAAKRAEARLTIAADPRWRTISAAQTELERVTSALKEIEVLASSRHPTTLLLGELTRALPEGAALEGLRLEGEAGSVVTLTPRAAHVLSALQDVRGISSPEIAAPIGRETADGKDLERVSVRFLLADFSGRSEAEP